MRKSFLVFLYLLANVAFGVAPQLSEFELLDRYKSAIENSLMHRGKSLYSAEEVTTMQGAVDNDSSRREVRQYNVFHDGGRINILARQKQFFEKESVELNLRGRPVRVEGPVEHRLQYLYDNGRPFWYNVYLNISQNPSSVYTSTKPRFKLRLDSLGVAARALEGYIPGDQEKPLWQILQSASTLRVRDTMETVGSHQTYVLEAETEHGRYTLWIDPEHGFNPRRIVVERQGGHLLDGRVLSSPPLKPAKAGNALFPTVPLKGHRVVLDSVEIERIGDTFVPTEAKISLTRTYSSDEKVVFTTSYKRTGIDLDPDFEAIGDAFVLDVSDGTAVLNVDLQMIKYQWQGGKVVPLIDQSHLDMIENTIEEIQKQAKFESVTEDVKTAPAVGQPNSVAPAPPTSINSTENQRLESAHSRPIWFFIVLVPVAAIVAVFVFRKYSSVRSSKKAPHCLWLMVFAIICGGIVCPRAIAAENHNRDNGSLAKRPSPGAYCGLYCLYATMKMAGKEVEFQELVRPEYLGSRKGSSLIELKRAAEDNGLYAEVLNKLTTPVLAKCPYPVVLHVKSDLQKKGYDHFELFMGTDSGQAKIFDPPEPVRTAPFHELAPRWDGSGLIVSQGPIDRRLVMAPARRRFIVYTTAGVGFILMVHLLRGKVLSSFGPVRSHKFLGLSAAQAVALTIAAVICGMIHHFASDKGFLAHADATSSIRKAHVGSFIPKVSRESVARLLDSDAVLIDARRKADYAAGHLEGAISVPVDANDRYRRNVTASIAKDATIVVYCQSAGCDFAETVAARLKEDDFGNVSIFKGGWRQWEMGKDD